MVIKKIGRGLKNLFGGTGSRTERPPQERQFPPEGRQMPPARAPREGTSAEMTAPPYREREFPPPPVDSSPTPSRPGADDWMPTSPEVRDLYGTHKSPRGRPLPREDPPEVPEGEALSRRFGGSAEEYPRSFPPPPEVPEGEALSRRFGGSAEEYPRSFPPPPEQADWDFWSGTSWGGGGSGGKPPRRYGGQGPDGPEPSGFSRKLFLIAFLSFCYVGYRWALDEIREDVIKELDRLESQKQQQEALAENAEGQRPKGEVLTAKTEAKSQRARSVVPLRGAPGMGRGAALRLFRGLARGFNDGLLLVRSFLSGPDLFVRAVRIVVYPVIRGVYNFALPPFIRGIISAVFNPFSFLSFLGPSIGNLIGFVASFGLTPIYAILTFFVSASVIKGLVGFIASRFVSPEIIEAVIPAWNHFFHLLQGCFATPADASVSAAFLEKGIKVFSISVSFGQFCNNIQLLIFPKQGERPSVQHQRIKALAFISIFGFSIYLILFDHSFISLFVQKTLEAAPSVGEFAASSFGQASLLLGSSVVVQSSGFPPVVTVFYASLLYISGLYQALIKEPPSPEASQPGASAEGVPPNSQK